MRRRPRVFLGLVEVAGYYTQLARGLEQLGCEVTLVALNEDRFGYRTGLSRHPLVAALEACAGRRRTLPAHRPAQKALWAVAGEALKVLVLLWAAARHDVFVFSSRTTFFRFHELRLLRLLGRRTVHVLHGSDSRPAYLNGALVERWPPARLIAHARRQKRDVQRIERSCDVVVSHPLHAQFHERPFVRSTALGIPFETPASSRRPERDVPLRVVHTPSNPVVKGTALLRRAVRELQAEGLRIDYCELVDRPHEEVLEALAGATVVVDQLYSDAATSGLAAEAAAFGRPVVIGGYAAAALAELVPVGETPAVVYCHPDQLTPTLRGLLADADLRREIGNGAQRALERWAPARVAERYLQIVLDGVPDAWWVDPRRIRYVHGIGLSEPRLRSVLAGVLRCGGTSALQLEDKPELLAALLRLVSADGGP